MSAERSAQGAGGMVERVARAMYATNRLRPLHSEAWFTYDELEQWQRDDYERQARAAIEAMREPSDEMIEAALDGFCAAEHDKLQGARLHLDHPFAVSFQSSLRRMREALKAAMIAAALAPAEGRDGA